MDNSPKLLKLLFILVGSNYKVLSIKWRQLGEKCSYCCPKAGVMRGYRATPSNKWEEPSTVYYK